MSSLCDLPCDCMVHVCTYLSSCDVAAFVQCNKYMYKCAVESSPLITKLEVGSNRLFYKNNDGKRHVFTLFAHIKTVCNEYIELQLLDLCLDGYGAMWPRMNKNNKKHVHQIRSPLQSDDLVFKYTTLDSFKREWIHHVSCKHHSVFFENTVCRCVHDAIQADTHIVKYIKKN